MRFEGWWFGQRDIIGGYERVVELGSNVEGRMMKAGGSVEMIALGDCLCD